MLPTDSTPNLQPRSPRALYDRIKCDMPYCDFRAIYLQFVASSSPATTKASRSEESPFSERETTGFEDRQVVEAYLEQLLTGENFLLNSGSKV